MIRLDYFDLFIDVISVVYYETIVCSCVFFFFLCIEILFLFSYFHTGISFISVI